MGHQVRVKSWDGLGDRTLMLGVYCHGCMRDAEFSGLLINSHEEEALWFSGDMPDPPCVEFDEGV